MDTAQLEAVLQGMKQAHDVLPQPEEVVVNTASTKAVVVRMSLENATNRYLFKQQMAAAATSTSSSKVASLSNSRKGGDLPKRQHQEDSQVVFFDHDVQS